MSVLGEASIVMLLSSLLIGWYMYQRQYEGEDTKITEDNLSVFVYILFREDFSPIIGTSSRSS